MSTPFSKFFEKSFFGGILSLGEDPHGLGVIRSGGDDLLDFHIGVLGGESLTNGESGEAVGGGPQGLGGGSDFVHSSYFLSLRVIPSL